MPTPAPHYDVLVLGGGGAGLMCALLAGRRGLSAAVVEHNEELGKKILISGGGRCNFTNLRVTADDFLSANPHFCKSALARFAPADFIAMVDGHGIPWFEKKLGQLFCKTSARHIVDMLAGECRQAGVDIFTSCPIEGVSKADGFVVKTGLGELRGDRLVVATGGLSIPKIGATGIGYDIARQFGLSIVPTEPALVGLRLDEGWAARLRDLSGIAVDTIARCPESAAFRENTLFTHQGLSGPAILQVSLFWREGSPVTVNWLPNTDLAEIALERKRENGKTEFRTVLADFLPKRLADALCAALAMEGNMAAIADKTIDEWSERIHATLLSPTGSLGYDKAEVTRGGVDTKHLSSRSMECKDVPGLYFIGEVVDVTGRLGGYNFQWAWASAHAAAESM